MSSFSQLKKARNSAIDKYVDRVENVESSSFSKDERFWEPTVDKAGNGAAIIRFLDTPEGEEYPWVRLFVHGFKGPTGQWYIENSLTTLDQPDPLAEYNSKLWNSTEDDKSPERTQARKQKRRLVYISNILVIDDPANPNNNGKVFLYKYGKKIFDMIKSKWHPDDPLGKTEASNPFDLWSGNTFNLRIKKKDGFRNYDSSTFDVETTPIAETDDEIEAIWKQSYSLKEHIDPSQFKSYEELKNRLSVVLGINLDTDNPELVTSENSPTQEKPKAVEDTAEEDEVVKVEEDNTKKDNNDEEEDDDLSYFKSLAE